MLSTRLMRQLFPWLLASLTLGMLILGLSGMPHPHMATAQPMTSLLGLNPTQPITLTVLGTYTTGVFDETAAEIVTHDPISQRLFVTNAYSATVDVLDVSDPTAPALIYQIDLTPYGDSANSVDFHDGVLAVAVEAEDTQANGQVVFFDADGNFLSQVTVGALPDMLIFTPDGQKVLVANEGEPSDDYVHDPEGSVSLIDLSTGVAALTDADVTAITFTAYNDAPLDPSVRIYGPGATVAQDVEPEYIAVSADSSTAWVTLQENNAVAVVDLDGAVVTTIVGLGFKDHSQPGHELDASDRDDMINITNWPVYGMYQPDAIVAYEAGGQTYLVTANEGDARDYDAYSEEERVKDLALDPTAFPDAAMLQDDANIGRLNVTTANGDIDMDGDYDALYAYGARSFTIWSADGALLFDSGAALELITADAYPDYFNADGSSNDSFDNRSDNKGPEPEALAVGSIHDRAYAFVGLERISGFVVYDVTDPLQPEFVQYVNNRDFTGDPEAGTAGDISPEGIVFIPASDSPLAEPLLAVANELSGSTTVYHIQTPAPTDVALMAWGGQAFGAWLPGVGILLLALGVFLLWRLRPTR